jgi:hypothetical protein
MTVLAQYGAITPNEMREHSPNLDLPRVEDNPAFDLPVEKQQQPASPFGGFGSPSAGPAGAPGTPPAPIGNVESPIVRTDAYTMTESELISAVRQCKKDVMKAVVEQIPAEGVNNLNPHNPVDIAVKPSLYQRVKNALSPVNNAEGDVTWITVNGMHIPIKAGETKNEAVQRAINYQKDKGSSGGGKGESTPAKKESKESKSTPPAKTKSEPEKAKAAATKPPSKFNAKQAEDDERYSPQEKAAVEKYRSISGSDYTAINEAARTGKTNATINHIDSAISKADPIPKGTDLYRGLSEKQAAALSNAKVGDSFKQGGYQSYSLDRDVADGFSQTTKGNTWSKTILKIEGDGAIKGVHIGSKEAEMLLARGQTYTITGRTVEKVKGTKIKVNIVTVKVGGK